MTLAALKRSVVSTTAALAMMIFPLLLQAGDVVIGGRPTGGLMHAPPSELVSSDAQLTQVGDYEVRDWPFLSAISSNGWQNPTPDGWVTTTFALTLPGIPAGSDASDAVLAFGLLPPSVSIMQEMVQQNCEGGIPLWFVTLCYDQAAGISASPAFRAAFTAVSVGNETVALPTTPQSAVPYLWNPNVDLFSVGLGNNLLQGDPVIVEGTAELSLGQGTVNVTDHGYNTDTTIRLTGVLTVPFYGGLYVDSAPPSQQPVVAYQSPNVNAATPEPTTLLLFGGGMLTLGIFCRLHNGSNKLRSAYRAR